jgi:hypothetical protein
MDHAITGTPAETVLYGALELSENSWLLALQFPDRAQPSLYPIRGGDTFHWPNHWPSIDRRRDTRGR